MNVIDILLGRRMQSGGGDGPALPELTNPAGAADILYGREVINSRGGRMTGMMPDNGAVVFTIDGDNPGFNIPEGYHDGNGWVGTTPEEITVTPSTTAQEFTPSPGKVLSKVRVVGLSVEVTDNVLIMKWSGV